MIDQTIESVLLLTLIVGAWAFYMGWAVARYRDAKRHARAVESSNRMRMAAIVAKERGEGFVNFADLYEPVGSRK